MGANGRNRLLLFCTGLCQRACAALSIPLSEVWYNGKETNWQVKSACGIFGSSDSGILYYRRELIAPKIALPDSICPKPAILGKRSVFTYILAVEAGHPGVIAGASFTIYTGRSMKLFCIVFTLFLVSTLPRSFAQRTDAKLINAASLLSGSFMRETPPSYTPTNLMAGDIQNYAPEALFDQSAKVWCSRKGAGFPFVFLIELTETFVIEELRFDNRCENYPGISAKGLRVQFATEVRNPRFEPVGDYTLNENVMNSFTIPAREARLIRIEIQSNHGNSQFTELAEFEAYGRSKLQEIQTIDIDGTWSSNWGDVFFNQNATLLEGHYVYNKGTILFGGVNRNQVSYRWVEKVIDRQGQTLMFLNQEGTRLTGIWCYDDNWKEYGFWILERETGLPFVQASAPEPEPPAKIVESVVREMHNKLTIDKKLVLYGINFAVNSSEIVPASVTVLRQLAEILLANPEIRIRIEGHTDSDGSEAHNDKLSLDRAQAVKSYLLTQYSIADVRVGVEGKGERFPVSSNETELGRAANRRVEVHNVLSR